MAAHGDEGSMRGSATLILVLLALLAVAAGFAWYVWRELGDVEISPQGYLALGIGVAVTLGLGVGLMWLVYFSHRRGFDDEAGHE
jgi:hypothetical protein